MPRKMQALPGAKVRVELVLQLGDLAADAVDFLFGLDARRSDAAELLDFLLERVNIPFVPLRIPTPLAGAPDLRQYGDSIEET